MDVVNEEIGSMAVQVIALHPNLTIEIAGLKIYTGIVECLFRGNVEEVTRDNLTFIITEPRISIAPQFQASGIVSLASIAFDGAVNNALWAVDSTSVATVNSDRGSGTANLQVFANLAVKGLNGLILRVNYSVFVKQ